MKKKNASREWYDANFNEELAQKDWMRKIYVIC